MATRVGARLSYTAPVILQRRLNLGLPQRKLAEQLGISHQCLSRYERGLRRWPPELLTRACRLLGCEPEGLEVISWSQHRRWSGHHRWQLDIEPGPNWADTPAGYDEFYRQLGPFALPSLTFRRAIRLDSSLEACVYSQLLQAGSFPVAARPGALHFPHHHLVGSSGGALGLSLRAAFLLPTRWLLWPQITFQLPSRQIRVDALAAYPPRWVALEFDGTVHPNRAWRDSQLNLPVLHYTPRDIFATGFATRLMQDLEQHRRRRR